MNEPYNPLHKRHLGESVAKALLESPAGPLPPAIRFVGAGIYAIYYTGSFELYRAISAANSEGKFALPIYVGKAVPEGARRGAFGLDAPAGNVLFNRLREHAGSIDEAENLSLADFQCRYLPVDDIWIPLAESLLISRFKPLWNQVVDGYGNHDPGSGRYQQKVSSWDILHPGRLWAKKLQSGLVLTTIEAKVRAHFETPATSS